MGIIVDDEKQREQLLYLYNILQADLPTFQEDIEAVIEDGSIGRLVPEMNESAGDTVSQDIHKIKDAIIPWLSDILERDPVPPIEPDAEKEKTRGFNHPDLGCLLCTPVKLPIFDKDPEVFCRQARENDLEHGPIVTAGHFPTMFYSDLGEQASNDPNFVFKNLLYGWLVILTWVFVFLGPTNVAAFRKNMRGLLDGKTENKIFKIKHHGKAYQNHLITVTHRTIAYATFILRHTLSASNDRRIEEGGVIKQDAFDAIVSLFKDEEFIYDEWVEQVLHDWHVQIDWMLPDSKKPQLVNENDKDSSLNHVARLVKARKEKKATKVVSDITNGSDSETLQDNPPAATTGNPSSSTIPLAAYPLPTPSDSQISPHSRPGDAQVPLRNITNLEVSNPSSIPEISKHSSVTCATGIPPTDAPPTTVPPPDPARFSSGFKCGGFKCSC
ncbi:hypothetical protein K435DRAFT_803269 [Dendrothele bispora CBS 962.96]|uniref:Uncharacterized protein n=1 Tax=Dendrothele bispora (strain CBS 962.96) TaxID=1314807 RepID=A0A4S8LIA0_DENBC|nr:hypothetical protein K435DRAFT_803269 [Dendrothele bispora CBS 962.96]